MDHHPNRIREQLAARQSAVGVKVDLPSPDIVEIAGRAGYHFVWIDCEHGPFDLETAVHMMRAADASGITPIVRVPDHQPSHIARMLDAGAKGILVPNVSTVEEARAIVQAARYRTDRTPEGRRGACPRIRAAGHQAADWNSFANWSNDNIAVWVLVETLEGAENAGAIAAVPGVDAVMPGPFDLSVSMGHGGDTTHPAVRGKLEDITRATLAAGKEVVAVLLAPTTEGMIEEKRFWEARGCRIFNAVSDRRMLSNGMAEVAKAMVGSRAPGRRAA